MSDTREEIHRKINIINDKLYWVGDWRERNDLRSHKLLLERKLEEMDRIEKEDTDEFCRPYIQRKSKKYNR